MNALTSRWHRPSWRTMAALGAAVAAITTSLVLHAGGTSTTAAGHRPSGAVHLAGDDTPADPNIGIPGMCSTQIRNVRDTGESETWPGDPNWQVDGWGPVDSSSDSPTSLSLGKSVTVANTFNSTVGVTAQAVSAQVGFNVTWSDTVDTSYQISVPPNQEWRIAVGYVAHDYLYDVYQACSDGTDQQIGTGVASQYDHLVYQTYQISSN